MKKIILGAGALTAAAAPLLAVMACGSKDELSTGVATFTVSQNVLATSRAANSDINKMEVDDIIDSINNDDVLKNISSKNEKIKLIIKYNDADVEVDTQVKDGNTNRIVVTVNKVYVKPKTGTFSLKESGSNISKFKKFTKQLVVALVEASKKQGLTAKQIKRELFASYGSSAGLLFRMFDKNSDHTALWKGTWEENVNYDRASFIFDKESETLTKLLSSTSPALTISTISSKLDIIEGKLREFAKTLVGDAELDAFAQAELHVDASNQSQITLATFTSASGLADDMVVFSINTLKPELINKFITKAMASNTLTGMTDQSAKAIWDTISRYSIAK